MKSIYCLKDPVSQEIKYVGATNRPLGQRLAAHRARAEHESSRKALWLQKLRQQGLRAHIELLEEAEDLDWEMREHFWIMVLGPDLLNMTAGGVGAGNMLPEVRAKISKAVTGKNLGNQNARKRSLA